VKKLSEELSIPLLAQIPLVQSIRESADSGRPITLESETEQALAFKALAQNTAQQVAIINAKKEEVPA
ncbi:MAG: MRP family ATP-binding protein, partial [Bacteroidia bacterium]